MRVLFDITHPAIFHFFRVLMHRLVEEGHDVLATARRKDMTVDLLQAHGLPYVAVGTMGSGLAGLAVELVCRDVQLYRVARRFRPDVMVGADGAPWVGHVGLLLGVPRIVFDQVDNAPIQQWLGLPFATTICTGTGYRGNWGRKQKHFRGFLAQAYLSRPYFEPDRGVLQRHGVDPDEPYVVIRLVSWGANHDIGKKGMDADGLRRLVEAVSGRARVFLSSEAPLPDDLQAYRLPVPAEQFHHLLAFADLCITEGGTLPAEAAVLGVPVISCESYDFGYLNALCDRYGLVMRAADLDEVMERAWHVLGSDEARRRHHAAWQRLAAESDDVAETMYRVVVGGVVDGR